ncbi:MAG TPA: phosphate signaling complex protein PhoU [Deltaproteobacteria bacterium]|nr:phosphate signaling complex protein PhoU [Deltaproteobacteria bacterium]
MLEEAKINRIKKELLEYATIVEGMIGKGIEGLTRNDEAMLEDVILTDEPRVNDFEIRLDEMCIAVVAQHQPAGKPLRTVFMMSSINGNLERMADHAVTICESGLFLISKPPVKKLIDIPRMGDVVKAMITDGIESFVNEDADLAMSVCERDSIVDGLRDQIMRELITFMTSDPATIERSLHLMKIAANLERVADLTTNICEDVIYMVKGKNIKHHKCSL